MKKIKKVFQKILTYIFIYYIEFVAKTTKIYKTGCYELVDGTNPENFVVCFWHGESHCCYPVLRDTGTYIVTTTNKRGEYIAGIGEHFGYIPLRIPDESKGENHVFKIRSMINGTKRRKYCIDPGWTCRSLS